VSEGRTGETVTAESPPRAEERSIDWTETPGGYANERASERAKVSNFDPARLASRDHRERMESRGVQLLCGNVCRVSAKKRYRRLRDTISLDIDDASYDECHSNEAATPRDSGVLQITNIEKPIWRTLSIVFIFRANGLKIRKRTIRVSRVQRARVVSPRF